MSRPQRDANPPSWQPIVDALAGESEDLAARISERLRAEIPTYRRMDRDLVDADVTASVDLALRLRLGEAPDDGELATIIAAAERQALRGDPLEDLLRAWRIGTNTVIEAARAAAERQGVDPPVMMDLVVSFLSWSDHTSMAVAKAHRRADLELARQDQERRGSLVRGVLQGRLPAAEIQMHLDLYRLDPQKPYVAVRARALPGAEPSTIARALDVDTVHLAGRGLLALMDGDVAGFLRALPPGDLPGVVGVGPARTLDRLGESFRLATRSLATAEAFGLTGAQPFHDLGLLPAILADQDVGDTLRRKYVDPVGATASAAEILTSVRTYLASAKHVETAAAKLVVHNNTLRYRIARFEELTGVDLRDSRVTVEVWWALESCAELGGRPARPE